MDATTRLFIELDVWLSQPEKPKVYDQGNGNFTNWHKALLETIAGVKIPPKLKNTETGRVLNEALALAQKANVEDFDQLRILIFTAHQSLEGQVSEKFPKNPNVEEIRRRLGLPDNSQVPKPSAAPASGKESSQALCDKINVDCLFSFPECDLQAMLDDPASMYPKSTEYAGNEERVMTLEDSWAIIRHLLSKASKSHKGAPRTILDSGTEIDAGEGEAYRIFRPKEVARIAAKLKSIPFETLADVFEVQDMFECDRGIDDSEVDSTLEYISHWYGRLSEFFNAAAKVGYCVAAF